MTVWERNKHNLKEVDNYITERRRERKKKRKKKEEDKSKNKQFNNLTRIWGKAIPHYKVNKQQDHQESVLLLLAQGRAYKHNREADTKEEQRQTSHS